MRELWLHTWELFRRKPVLWMPVIFADLVNHSLETFRKVLLHDLTRWSMEQHSVLGGGSYGPPPGWLVPGAGLVGMALLWLAATAYVFAAVVTARWVVRELGLPREAFSRGHRSYVGSALLTSLLTILLAVVFGAAVVAPVLSYLQHIRAYAVMLSPYVIQAETLPAYLVVAFVVTPFLLRTLARALGCNVPAGANSMGRKLALGIAAVAVVVNTMVAVMRLPEPLHGSGLMAMRYLQSLMEAIPFVPLFIGLGVLVCKDAEAGAEAAVEAGLDSGA